MVRALAAMAQVLRTRKPCGTAPPPPQINTNSLDSRVSVSRLGRKAGSLAQMGELSRAPSSRPCFPAVSSRRGPAHVVWAPIFKNKAEQSARREEELAGKEPCSQCLGQARADPLPPSSLGLALQSQARLGETA